MSGLWVFVCGASGVGKDSVIDWAATNIGAQSDVVFSRRMVTRTPRAGSDHDLVDLETFEQLRASGGLAWYWAAHGFHYGVPVSYAADVAAGRTVVINGSREHVAGLAPSAAIKVVKIEASPEKLAARLVSRGRDAPLEVALRLTRNEGLDLVNADETIANDGALPLAGSALVRYLLATCETAR